MVAAVVLLASATLAVAAPRFQNVAEKSARNFGVVELAHATITEVQGTTKFHKREKGGYDFLIYKPEKIGDAITFSIRVPRSDDYSLQTTTYKDGEEGIYQLEVDGEVVNQKDFYLSNVWEHGEFYVKKNTYSITYRCIGQNPKSPGIGVRLGNLDFR